MKLLGQFPVAQGNGYIDLLESKGIEVGAEDIFVECTTYKGQQYHRHDVKLLVPEKDLEKAAQIIKEGDVKQSKEIEADGKEAANILLKILIAGAILIALIILTYTAGFKLTR